MEGGEKGGSDTTTTTTKTPSSSSSLSQHFVVDVQLHLSKRDLNAAKEKLAQGLLEFPDSIPLLFEYHVICIIEGHLREAAIALLKIFSIEPNNEVLLLRIADLALPQVDSSLFAIPSSISSSFPSSFLPPRPSGTPYLWPPVEGLFDFFDLETKEHMLINSANLLISKQLIEHAFALHWLVLKWTQGKADVWFITTNLALECERRLMAAQLGNTNTASPFIFPFERNNCSAYRRFLVEECLSRMFYPGMLRFDRTDRSPIPTFGDKVAWVLVAMHYYITTWKWNSIYYLFYLLAHQTPLELLFPPIEYSQPPYPTPNHRQRQEFINAIVGLLVQQKQSVNSDKGTAEPLANVDMMTYCWMICGILLHSAWCYSKATVGIETSLLPSNEGGSGGPEVAFRAALSSMSKQLLVLLVQHPGMDTSPSEEIANTGSADRARSNLHLVRMCWEQLIKADVFTQEFSTLYGQWQLDKCDWLQHALADMALFEVQHVNASVIYQRLLGEEADPKSRKGYGLRKSEHYWQKLKLQMGCCSLCDADYVPAERLFLEILCKLFPRSKQTRVVPKRQTVVARQEASEGHKGESVDVFLLALGSEEDFVDQCVRYLIECYLRQRMLGNLLIVLQHKWPLFEGTFQQLVQSEVFREFFECPTFYEYVVNIDICEEFARLLHKGFHLRIGPKETFQERDGTPKESQFLLARMERHIVATSATTTHACLTRFFTDQLQQHKNKTNEK